MKNKTAIFMMGLPAAGKSTYVASTFTTFNVIDPDAIKATHPDYNPKDPTPLHAWSKAESERLLDEAYQAEDNVIIDGTGTSAEKMVSRVNRAKALGYTTKLIFLKVSLETSLKRNAARARVVPTEVIVEKAETVSTAFEIVKQYVDSHEIVHND